MSPLPEIASLTQKLITFKTTADHPESLSDSINYIADFFKDSGVLIKRFERNQKPSLFVSLGPANPELLFNGHADVVPAKDEQFSPILKDSKIFGRGALDMKGGLAVLLVLMKQLTEEKANLNVGLSVVTDEEIGGQDGTGLMVEEGVRPKFFLAAEPTDLQIGNEARGIIWLKIKTVGKTAHAATPWLGENANVKLIKILNNIQVRFPTPTSEQWLTTRNISAIKGGDAINKVPDAAQATLDIRYIPGDDPQKIIEEIKDLSTGGEIEVLNLEPAAYTDPNDAYLKKLSEAVKENGLEPKFLKKYAASDARYYTKAGIPAVVFGPSGQGQHSDTEFVDLTSLEKTYNTILDFVKKA